MPTGKDGLVVNDLDLVIKWHGPRFVTGPGQRTRLLEIKHGNASMTYAQVLQFAEMDFMMSRDPERYDGFFLLSFDHTKVQLINVDDTWLEFPAPDTTFTVTGEDQHMMQIDELAEWLQAPRSPFRGMGSSKPFRDAIAKLYGQAPVNDIDKINAILHVLEEHAMTPLDLHQMLPDLYWLAS